MLVSVVVPAYNAAETICQTLQSIIEQTHKELEIIVVDDGSSDATPSLVEEFCAVDARIKLIRQTNQGVAAARNAGWHAAKASLIAFIDADDLWDPRNIELQLACMQQAPPQVGLVYSHYVQIDPQNRVLPTCIQHAYRGQVMEYVLKSNFIGNCSSILVRREILRKTSGFDSRLRMAGATGCEDYLFYCRAVGYCEFEVVAQPLVGYRLLPNNMSSNLPRMLRSWLLVCREMSDLHPHYRQTLEDGLVFYAFQLIQTAFKRLEPLVIAQILFELYRQGYRREALLLMIRTLQAIATKIILWPYWRWKRITRKSKAPLPVRTFPLMRSEVGTTD